MLLCNGQIELQQSKSAEIASAIERFLADGNSIAEIPPGASGESAASYRAIRISVPGKPKATPPARKAKRKASRLTFADLAAQFDS